MTYTVGFTAGALQDLREAQAWYEDKHPSLGARFSDAVERQARSLQSMPEKYRKVHKDIHLCSVPKFPFELYYQIEDSRVVILVVHAVRQNPKVLAEKFKR